MAETLVNTLYITVRPLILSQQEIDSLCDLIHILKNSSIRSIKIAHTFHAMEYITRKLLEDVQERLVYRVEKFILEEIELFTPTADLNYQVSEKFNEDLAVIVIIIMIIKTWHIPLRYGIQHWILH